MFGIAELKTPCSLKGQLSRVYALDLLYRRYGYGYAPRPAASEVGRG